MVISLRTARIPFLGVAGLALVISGCGGGVSEFSGGSNSKDKTSIPSAVASASTSEALAVVPQVQAAVAVKVKEEISAKDEKDLRKERNMYRATRNRDPFRSLIGSDHRTDVVDLSVVELVGVMMSGDRPFAVVEDADGNSFVLRKGDRVKNGRVVRIKADALVCSQTVLGYTTTVQLKLENGKDVKNG